MVSVQIKQTKNLSLSDVEFDWLLTSSNFTICYSTPREKKHTVLNNDIKNLFLEDSLDEYILIDA